jgi:alpha-L-arabinofuranosidase B-like protein
MRRHLLLVACLLIGAWSFSRADDTIIGGGISGMYKPSSSSLPLDGITSGLQAAYSTRKLLTAYAGNALQVTRASDSTTQNIGFSSNVLNSGALTTFCSGTTCTVSVWYDQSGNGNNLTTACPAGGPVIYAAGAIKTINSQPALLFAAAGPNCVFSSTFTSNPVNSRYENAIINPTSTASGESIIASDTLGGMEWRVDNSNATMSLLSQDIANIATSSSTTFSATGNEVEAQYNSSTGVYSFWLSGSSVGTGTNAVSPFSGHTAAGAQFNSSAWVEGFAGPIGEEIIYDSSGGISGAARTQIRNSQTSYWGVP